MDPQARILVTGGDTLIGAAILRALGQQGYGNIAGQPGLAPNWTCAEAVDRFFDDFRPEYVFVAAGKSGGIRANQKHPATLMLDNLLGECHTIDSAHRYGVRKLLYLASSCSYPKFAPQPMRAESLLTGPLEPTNEAYAVAKIAGIKLCEAYRQEYGDCFISAIPANAFGVGDDFDPQDAHVIGALMYRMHHAKQSGAHSVEIWGTGSPRREFVFADDLADACVFVLRHYDGAEPINLGGGADLSIGQLAQLVRDTVGYTGQLAFDHTKPDGMPVKLLDSSRLLSMGWQPRTPFPSALAATYDWFLRQHEQGDQ